MRSGLPRSPRSPWRSIRASDSALSMGLLLFALTFAVERCHLVSAAAFSIAVVALTYLLFTVALKTPVEQGPFGF